jgi:hypothetical protein
MRQQWKTNKHNEVNGLSETVTVPSYGISDSCIGILIE